jgi:hypothetical protein
VEDHAGGRVAVGDCVGQCVPLRKTCKSERAAQIEFGKLLEQAAAGRQPDSDVTVAPAARPVRVNPPGRTSTRKTNLGCIRWTIEPAFGSAQVGKVGGALTEYAGTLGVISPSRCSRCPGGAGGGVSSARGLFCSW